MAALLASISLRLSSTASAASCKPFAKSTMSLSWRVIAALVASLRAVTSSPMSLTFLPILSVYFANSSKSALSALVPMAALLASMSWRLASKASAAVKPAFFKLTMSSSIRATAVVVASLRLVTSSPMSLTFLPISAVYFANSSKSVLSALVSIAALLAFTSALMSLTTAAVFTSASLFSVTALFKPSSVSSCAATTSFKPMPSKSAFSTSSFVAVRMTFEPSSLVTTI